MWIENLWFFLMKRSIRRRFKKARSVDDARRANGARETGYHCAYCWCGIFVGDLYWIDARGEYYHESCRSSASCNWFGRRK